MVIEQRFSADVIFLSLHDFECRMHGIAIWPLLHLVLNAHLKDLFLKIRKKYFRKCHSLYVRRYFFLTLKTIKQSATEFRQGLLFFFPLYDVQFGSQ